MTSSHSGKPHALNDNEPQPAPPVPGVGRTLILGHRGAPKRATENTLEAFDLARRDGADGVELDVRRAQDGGVVVIHDDSLERTMEVKGALRDLAAGAIQRLTNARVPIFEQAAAWAAASGSWVNVEFKDSGIEEPVIELIRKMGLEGRTILSSFQPAIVQRLRADHSDLLGFLLCERWDAEARENADAVGAQGVCVGVAGSSNEVLEQIAERGLATVVWTANEPNDIQRLLSAGIFAVITDVPDVAAGIRNRMPST